MTLAAATGFGNIHGAVSACLPVAHYLKTLRLINVLDDLREAYALARQAQQPEIASRLMRARRVLVEALHEDLDLHSQNEMLLDQLAEARAENARLRCDPADAALTLAATGPGPRRTS